MRTLASPRVPSLRPSILVIAIGALGSGSCGDPQPAFTEPRVLGGQTVSPDTLNRGLRVYSLYCVSCHGVDGSGRTSGSRSLSTPPRDFREADFRYVSGPEGSLPTDEDLDLTVRKGRPGTGMPPWDGMPQEDRHAVIQYLKTFSTRWTTEVPPAAPRAEG